MPMTTMPAPRRRWLGSGNGGDAPGVPCIPFSAGATRRARNRLEDQHLRDRPAVFFLRRRVYTVCPHVDDQAMNFLWNPNVLDLAESIWLVDLKDWGRAAAAGDI